jgi:hypothetical protein
MIDRSYLVVLVPGLPVLALGRSLFWDLQTSVFKILWVLQDVPNETSAQVPCDMTVEWLTGGVSKVFGGVCDGRKTHPKTGVVLVPLQDNVGTRLKLSNVAPRRVGGVGDFAVPAGAEVFEGFACSSTA